MVQLYSSGKSMGCPIHQHSHWQQWGTEAMGIWTPYIHIMSQHHNNIGVRQYSQWCPGLQFYVYNKKGKQKTLSLAIISRSQNISKCLFDLLVFCGTESCIMHHGSCSNNIKLQQIRNTYVLRVTLPVRHLTPRLKQNWCHYIHSILKCILLMLKFWFKLYWMLFWKYQLTSLVQVCLSAKPLPIPIMM